MTGFGGMVSFELDGTPEEAVGVRVVAPALRARREPRRRARAGVSAVQDDARVDSAGDAAGARAVGYADPAVARLRERRATWCADLVEGLDARARCQCRSAIRSTSAERRPYGGRPGLGAGIWNPHSRMVSNRGMRAVWLGALAVWTACASAPMKKPDQAALATARRAGPAGLLRLPARGARQRTPRVAVGKARPSGDRPAVRSRAAARAAREGAGDGSPAASLQRARALVPELPPALEPRATSRSSTPCRPTTWDRRDPRTRTFRRDRARVHSSLPERSRG